MRKSTLAGLLAGAAMTLATASSPVAAAETQLRIATVDVEGGAATLYVTPEGHSLLVDTGWPAGMGGPRPAPGADASPASSSAERVKAAAELLGVRRIDYLLLSHYHLDHIGGVHDLMAIMPVGTFVDHGPNREEARAGATPQQLATTPSALYPKYAAAIAGKPHRVMRPGDTLKIDGLVLTAVDADREVIKRPLPGAGKPNPACEGVAPAKENNGGEENPRSLGFVATFGKARILALGDTTWDMENKLACPIGLIGPIDLLITTHHGSNLSGSPAFFPTIAPTVAVTDNGATKGGDIEVFQVLKAQPGLQDIWQLHQATRSAAANPAPEYIANLEGRPDQHLPLMIRVDRSGAVTVSNPRNGLSKTYPKAAR